MTNLSVHLRVGACVSCPGGQELSDWPILALPPSPLLLAPPACNSHRKSGKTTTNTTEWKNNREVIITQTLVVKLTTMANTLKLKQASTDHD